VAQDSDGALSVDYPETGEIDSRDLKANARGDSGKVKSAPSICNRVGSVGIAGRFADHHQNLTFFHQPNLPVVLIVIIKT